MSQHPFYGSKSFFVSWLFLLLFFTVCVLFPLLCVVVSASVADFWAVIKNPRLMGVLGNTALECIVSTVLSVFTGYVYAYAVVKARIPCTALFSAIPIVHLVTPPFVGGLAFILLLGRQGFITRTMLHLDVSLYGFGGLILAQTLTFFPIAYLICAQALRGINPFFEQAARGMGATGTRVFFSITLPLSFPGIAGAALFIAVSVLSDFGNPMIVAGRFKVLATEIYTQLNGWLNTGVSVILGFFLLVPSFLLFFLQHTVLKKNESRMATIGTKTVLQEGSAASVPTKSALTAFCVLIGGAVAAQFLAIIAGSFQTLWGVDTHFTLLHIKKMWRWLPDVKNTLCMAFFAALLSTAIASLSAYFVHRAKSPLWRFYDTLSQIPAALPGSLLGLALSIAAAKTHFFYPRPLILVAMTVAFLPFSYRSLSLSYSQIKTNLDEAAFSLGADRLYVLRSILLPLSAHGFFSSFIYAFVRGVGTVSAVIFLISFDTPLASVTILNLAEQGDWGQAAALALILTLATFALLALGRFFTHTMQKARGGRYAVNVFS